MIKANKGKVEANGLKISLIGEFGTICMSLIESGAANKDELIKIVEIANKRTEVRKNETDKPRRNI